MENKPPPALEWAPTGERIESAEQLNGLISGFVRANYAITPKGRQKGTYKLSESDRQNIHRLHQQGNSNRKIADMYGVSEKTIRNYLKQFK